MGPRTDLDGLSGTAIRSENPFRVPSPRVAPVGSAFVSEPTGRDALLGWIDPGFIEVSLSAPGDTCRPVAPPAPPHFIPGPRDRTSMDGEEIRRVYRESIGVLSVSLLGGLFAGGVLGSEPMRAAFRQYPGLLLLLPAFLATRGNVYGAFGARLSSGLHQGLIEPQLAYDERLANAVVASFVNGIGISVVIGVLSWGVLRALGRESARLAELVGVTLVSGLLTSVVLVVGLLLLVFGSYELGLDPDNLVGPIVTTLGDIFGVVFLYVAVVIVGVVL